MIDYFLIGLLLIPFALIVFVVGVLTLGLGWFLFGTLGPAVALIYVWNTLGGRNQATIGMQMMGIRLDRLDGRPVDGMLAVVHTVLFWAANVGPDPADPACLAGSRSQAHAPRPDARHGRHAQRTLTLIKPYRVLLRIFEGRWWRRPHSLVEIQAGPDTWYDNSKPLTFE